MKKNTTIKYVIGVLLLATLVVGAWILFSPNGDTSNEPNRGGKSTSDPSSTTPIPTSSDETPKTASPTDKDSREKRKAEFLESENKVEGAKEVDFFSKEDVESALAISQEYAKTALTNPYFLSGEWGDEGYPINQLDNAIGQYFSQPMRERILKFDSKTTETKDILPLVFFVNDNGEIAPSPLCIAANDPKEGSDGSGMTCPLNSLKISEMKFYPLAGENNDNRLAVEFTATTKIPVTIKENATPGFTEVKYDYHLEFINNPYYDEVTNPQKFVIAGYDNAGDAGKVQATK